MKRNRSRKRNSPGKARTSDPRQVSLDQCEFNPQGLFLTLVNTFYYNSEVLQLRRSSTKYLTRRLYKATRKFTNGF
ncbi:unnamed protein product [Fusarium graminearum]|nr:unnamed protein product [Fusarium graminearum]CAG2000475.1 unnamed protein product [Fusarium graminearum]VTO93158.1 unnamed protein product [Fusarium graminearum]